MKIYIPTYRRPGKVRTLKTLEHYGMLKQAVLVVRREEMHEYAQAHPEIKLLVIPNTIKDIGHTRQYIVKNSKEKIICMMDDDISILLKKPNSETWALQRAKKSDVNQLFATVERMMKNKDTVMAGPLDGIGAARPSEAFKHMGHPVRQFIFLHRQRFLEKSSFTIFSQCLGDIGASIECMYNGGDVITFSNWAYGSAGGAKTKKDGGCGTYRTQKMKNDTRKKMASRWPQYVEATKKEDRVTLRVKWKKLRERRV